MLENNYTDEIIAILPYGRSGTLFIQSLLDSHPELICLPPIYNHHLLTHLQQNEESLVAADMAFEVLYNFFENCLLGNNAPTKEVNIRGIQNLNISLKVPFSHEQFKAAFFEIFGTLSYLREDPVFRTFKATFLAYDLAISSDVNVRNKPKKLVFQLHMADAAKIAWLAKRCQKLHILQMLRSPLISFASDIRSGVANQKNGFGKLTTEGIAHHALRMFFSQALVERENVNHFGVSLERLHEMPERTLDKLSNVLDIPLHETLNLSTFSGNYWGNFKGKENIQMFSPEAVNENCAIDDILPGKDANLFGSLLQRFFVKWGYRENYDSNCINVDEALTHRFYFEYLPHFKNLSDARVAWKEQAVVPRAAKFAFALKYAVNDNFNAIEVLL